MSVVIVTRWQRQQRRLSQTEVDGYFATERTRPLLFVYETRRLDVEPHTGNLSIKFVTRGQERYVFDRGVATLAPGRVLIVNDGERYASSVEERTHAVSCFLPPHDISDAIRAIRARTDQLLDCPEARASDAPSEFAAVPFRPSAATQASMARLVSDVRFDRVLDLPRIGESVASLTLLALHDALALCRPHALSTIGRPSTRHELIARVMRARDAIEDCRGMISSLDELARLACLSKYHFLRVFAAVFGRPPMAYARDVRLRRARQALDQRVPAAAVARSVGLSSASALRRALAGARHDGDGPIN